MTRLLRSIAVVGVLASACTAQQRYDQTRDEQRHKCELAVSEALREQCLERLAPASYEEYELLRRTLPAPGDGATS